MPRDIHELEQWIKENPVKADVYALGIAILILEVAMILEQLIIWIGRHA